MSLFENTVFTYHRLFLRLSDADFAELLCRGFLILGSRLPEPDWPYTDERILKEGDLCLAGAESSHVLDHYLDRDYRILSFQDCLRRIYAARYTNQEDCHILTLVHSEPLLVLIDDNFSARAHTATRFDADQYSFIGNPELAEPPYVEGYFAGTPDTRELDGLFSLCSCGFAGCGCSLALIRQYELLLYIDCDSEAIRELWLLPEPESKAISEKEIS